MPEVSLQSPRIVPLVSVREHVRVRLEAKPRLSPSALDHARKAAVLNGAPRSEVNTKGDFGSCSRWSRRRARSSSPRIGSVLGACFTLRTCNAPEANST